MPQMACPRNLDRKRGILTSRQLRPDLPSFVRCASRRFDRNWLTIS